MPVRSDGTRKLRPGEREAWEIVDQAQRPSRRRLMTFFALWLAIALVFFLRGDLRMAVAVLVFGLFLALVQSWRSIWNWFAGRRS